MISSNDCDRDISTLMTVERGLKVLRAFRSNRAPLTNAELVLRTGLPKATVSRLTSTLVQAGFLRLVPGKRGFELSTGALGIGHAYLATNDLLNEARPLLQELADRLDVSVALGIQDGVEMLYVDYRVSRKVATLRLGVGSVLPMSTTSIGRAYLWGLPEPEQLSLIEEHKRLAGPQAEALESAIHASFRELETTGTCAVLAGFQRNTYGVSLPVCLGQNRTLMAMSCGKADVDLDLKSVREHIAPALTETAERLQAQLANSSYCL
ncbi:IclR family transcriptional regulator [Pandoraea terrigena]|uniref:IclR family transcriptional regulator n=1 Tax=Pandoraea terrigena TaxID=2508292 RepID=A0A5E4YP94_9BURK|nr:IclR family transcriptional regulator [Pandoraea terrigena]VVE50225.1 IclR family transcriptional regulator [Pandoraea terrigena]